MTKTKAKTSTFLFLNSASDFSIRDDDGGIYTPEQAKAMWEAGHVRDCNYAFRRLVSLGFDVDAVKKHYGSGNR